MDPENLLWKPLNAIVSLPGFNTSRQQLYARGRSRVDLAVRFSSHGVSIFFFRRCLSRLVAVVCHSGLSISNAINFCYGPAMKSSDLSETT